MSNIKNNFLDYIKVFNEVKPRHKAPNGHFIFNKYNSLEWNGKWDCEKCMFYIHYKEIIEEDIEEGIEESIVEGIECDMNSCIHYTKYIGLEAENDD